MSTPRERVQAALAGGHADRVPFTMYSEKLPAPEEARALRRLGLCEVRRVEVYKIRYPNAQIRQETITRRGRQQIRTVWDTPRGAVSTLVEPAGYTTWTHERMFKTPNDYPALRFLLEDARVEADYAPLARAMKESAGCPDVVFRTNFGLEPMQELISGPFMGMETWCMEWMDNRDEILGLYKQLTRIRREAYLLVADSPADHANYGGNVTPSIIGREIFRDYYLPHYQEAADFMHARGKKIGCHFDADCGLLRDLIASTALDYIEAFTPVPDTDMSLSEAREAWPDKVLWLNFPSSVHLKSDDAVRATTVELLSQAGGPDGLLIGITEDIPEHRTAASCRAILEVLHDHAKEYPSSYG